MFVAYVVGVSFYWKWENSFIFGLIGQTFWIGMIFYACSFFGPLQIPALFIAFGYVGVGFVYHLKYSNADRFIAMESHGDSLSILDKCGSYWQHRTATNIHSQEINSPKDVEEQINQSDVGEPVSECGSDVYFKALFTACLIIIFYKQLLMIFLAFIPIGVYLGKKLIERFGIADYAAERLEEVTLLVQVGVHFNYIVSHEHRARALLIPSIKCPLCVRVSRIG